MNKELVHDKPLVTEMLEALEATEKMFIKSCRDTFSGELTEEEIQDELNKSETVRKVRAAIARAKAGA